MIETDLSYMANLEKGHVVKRFDPLTVGRNGDLVPANEGDEVYGLSLEDVDSTEGRREIHVVRHGKTLE